MVNETREEILSFLRGNSKPHRKNKQMKKYELTNETIEINGVTLYRIRALRDVDNYAKAGDLGGWVQSEENLLQNRNCWVKHDAKVFGNAKVTENALVCGNALVRDNAYICGKAFIYGLSVISQNAHIGTNAQISGGASISGDARVSGNVKVSQNAKIHGNATIYGNASISGLANVSENVLVYEDAWVSGNANISGDVRVYGKAKVYGNALMYGDIRAFRNVQITKLAATTNLFGQYCNTTFTDNHLIIGCQVKTYKEWMEMTKEEVEEKYGKEWTRRFTLIRAMIEEYDS